MPPDADKLRQRQHKVIGEQGRTATAFHDDDDSDRVIGSTLDQLRSNEVCIDGVIYDLTSFHHPGGESFLLFGGNDVSVQYRMIHPYHTNKHLEKMKKTGKVADYTSE
jgi:acyl-lipid (7-3)-desaturase (Delta-4 desaturase)